MKEGDHESFKLFRMLAPALPFYVMKMSGKFDVELDPEDLTNLLQMPQAQMANVNAHGLLSSMSKWGTLDDMELIHYEDEEGDGPAFWKGSFENYKSIESPGDAVQAFFDKLQKGVLEE